MKKIIGNFIAVVSILVAGQALAIEAHDTGVNHRQRHQDQRIKQGICSGELTRGETKELAGERHAIRKAEHVYKADGKLTVEERRDLHQGLNTLSKDIYLEKHDDERRPYYGALNK